MKLFIVGHKGWIGGKYIKYCEDNGIDFCHSDKRAGDRELEQEIIESGATHIVSTIGRTHGGGFPNIDYLQQDGTVEINVNDNLYSPINLSFIAERNGLHFTYIGTGCIFSYDDEHKLDNGVGFTEEDEPNFFGSNYSIVKGFTDRIMKNFKNTLNLRIRMPITDEIHHRNFITKISGFEKVCSIPNSMTVLDELIPLSFKMMDNREVGTFNYTNPGAISHNEILEIYKELCVPDFEWKNMTVDEQDKVLFAKRSNNLLDTTKLSSKYQVDDIHTAVRKCLERMSSRFDKS